MKAILKRELKSYFSSPIGYVCISVLVALYGMNYTSLMLTGSSSYVSQVFSSMFMFSMMIIPIITMKSMSEDRKNKTDQALLTAPIGVTSIVVGKFLAAFGVYFVACTVSLLPAVAMNSFSNPPWGIIFGNYIATLLYGGAMVAIGIFISSLTESQVISAIGSFVIAMLLLFMDSIASSIGGIVGTVITWMSFTTRYNIFATGLFSVSSTVFFLSVIAAFIFLTARKLESRRWS
ncbi:MAG: ABC transporter permease [Clostridia bacterium]